MKYNQFIVEGDKLVSLFLEHGSWEVQEIFAKKEWVRKESHILNQKEIRIHEISFEELKRISFLKTPHNVLALVRIPVQSPSVKPLSDRWSLLLESIQDPGNLGAILRIAAWFGIEQVICSRDSVDVFNPKVVQASMGGILMTEISYTDLQVFLNQARTERTPVYGMLLSGTSIFTLGNIRPGIILLGNESRGISDDLKPFITEPVTIPGNPEAVEFVNSLNLSTAAAVTCAILTAGK